MVHLLLLLLVGTAFAQESGDDTQENFADKLMETSQDESDNMEETFDEAEGENESEDEWDGNDLSMLEEYDNLKPDFTENAEDSECPEKGRCRYHIFLNPKSFLWAWFTCLRRKGNLASIHSSRANLFLARAFRRHVRNSIYVWIGVAKGRKQSRYCNVDGSRLNYSNWSCGNRKRRGLWCVAMNKLTGKWVSLSCHRKLPYVCTY
ncbi:snaclec 3-like [Leptodactylus fuscus]|uniref:snaclec 3-like n=1 Tax=Leptodactylus fuscus TaxID=238119 RepID=UPI003F4EDDE7